MAKSPRGFQRLAPSASLPQAVTTINDNFQQMFAYMEQAFGGLDALKSDAAGRTFTLNSKSNPVVRNNLYGKPNDEVQSEPRDKVRLIEKSRQTERVKIYNPDDETQWIEILRITELVMYDKQTGIEWVWKLGNVDNLGDTTSSVAGGGGNGGGGSFATFGSANAGTYYRDPDIFLVPAQNAGASVVSQGMSANVLYQVPLAVPFGRTFTSIAINVESGAGVGKIARLGIYNLNTNEGGPGTLAVDCGTTPLETTGLLRVAFSKQLGPGVYFLAFVANNTISLRACTPAFALASMGMNLAGAAYAVTNVFRAFTFGALPTDESVAVYTNAAGSQPIIGIR